MSEIRALVVEDDAPSRDVLVELVRSEGYTVAGVASLTAARASLREAAPELLLLDVRLPDGGGTDLLAEAEGFAGDAIIVTGQASRESALEALRAGAIDYLVKPIDVQRLRTVLRHVRRQHELRREVGKLRGELRSLGHFGGLIGVSPAMQAVYDRLGRVAPTDLPVLLTGETGTGKELAARTLHELSRRRPGSFVAVNCAAIAATLLESELFGHERGSFSGADRRHSGHFERADGGTLFLDEVTEMPIELQGSLLRTLETGRVLRVGGEREVQVDVRVVAATNRSPDDAVAAGKLREDLRYRLDVLRIEMPPLRARREDIGLLAAHFLAELNKEHGAERELSPEAIAVMEAAAWPGNVRELRSVVQSCYLLGDDVIDVGDLPASLVRQRPAPPPPETNLPIRVGMTVAQAERVLVESTLRAVSGHRTEAAALLGVSVKTLYNRLRAWEDGGSDSDESAPVDDD